MKTQPLISVCINCFNAEDTIAETVASVLAQTYTHLQVIVVDDCSTDTTVEVLHSFSDERLEIHVLPENGQMSLACNAALSHAKGEYIAHLDADDVWFPDKLQKQLEALAAHPDCGACFAMADMVDGDDHPIEDTRFKPDTLDRAAMFRRFLTSGNYLCHSSALIRREAMEATGGYNPTVLYFQDFDCWLRLLSHTGIYICTEPLLRYRVLDNANSAMTPEKLTVHINEWARITYGAVVNCRDELFLEAFADRLRLEGTHSPEQTALEKAFCLLELFMFLPQNRVLGIRRLAELLRDNRHREVASRDFGFTVKDLYALERTPLYHDAAFYQYHDELTAHLNGVIAIREQELAHALTIGEQRLEENRTLHTQLNAMRMEKENTAAALRLMQGSLSWKITKPLRAVKRMFGKR